MEKKGKKGEGVFITKILHGRILTIEHVQNGSSSFIIGLVIECHLFTPVCWSCFLNCFDAKTRH